MIRRLAAVGALLLLVAVGTGALLVRSALRPAASAPAEPTLFVVPEGATLRRVARALEDAGLVRRARAFEALARWRGAENELRSGEYELRASDAPAAILDALRSGRVKMWEVAIPEGLTAVEIAARVEEAGLASRADFLAVVNDPASPARYGVEGPGLEGYLFPETYHLAKGLPAEEVVGALLAQFHEVWATCEGPVRARGLSMRQAVTLASLVEKETGAPAGAAPHRGRVPEPAPARHAARDRPVRDLRHPELRREPDAGAPRRRVEPVQHLPHSGASRPDRSRTPAPTRCAPWRSPRHTDSLYFVSRNDGTHAFSRTYAEHVGNVRRYQLRGEVGDGERSP